MKRITIALAVVTAMLTVIMMSAPAAHAADMGVPATGQMLCYDNAGNDDVPCANTGMNGDTQTGVAWPDPRFTVNADTTITDHLTGLTWAPDATGLTTGPLYDACGDANENWDSLLEYVSCLNAENYLGYSDWRLPNMRELLSLINVAYNEADCGGSPCESTAAWLEEQGFTGIKLTPTKYWVSTTEGAYTGVSTAFEVAMDTGVITQSNKINSHYGWPVRGTATAYSGLSKTANEDCSYYDNHEPRDCTGTGSDAELQEGIAWPDPRFTENGDDTADFDGTVTDNLTGLVWLKDANCIDTKYSGFDTDAAAGDGWVTWANALAFVAAMNAGTYPDCSGGYTDWRLPNLHELWSLAEYSISPINDPLPVGHPFLNDPPGTTWSSTTAVEYIDPVWVTTDAWTVGFTDGERHMTDKDGDYPVWPVRGGLDATGAPDIEVASSVDMGDVTIGTQADVAIEINNLGGNYLYLGGIALNDALAAPFSIISDPCSNGGVAPGGSCTITARFEPATEGDATDTFDVPSNDPDEDPLTVSLNGTGTTMTTTGTPPTACDLVYPADGLTGLGSEVTLIWKKATDAVDPTYDLDVCESDDFAGCATIENIASLGRTQRIMTIAKNWMTSLVAGPLALAGCGGGSGASDTGTSPSIGADEMSYTVTGLAPATTYYWKVTVADANGSSASAIRRFTTE